MGEQEKRKSIDGSKSVARENDDEIKQFSKRNGVTLKEARQLIVALRLPSTKPIKPGQNGQ